METAAISDDLVSRACAGDAGAVSGLFAAITPQVRIMVNARLNPTLAQTQLAEDIVQESLLALGESIGTLQRRTGPGLRAFTSTIVSRRVADALRHLKRDRGRAANAAELGQPSWISHDSPLWAMLSASGASPLTQADHADLVPRLMSALQSLKAEQRQAITLAFFDQLETSDIAAELNISRPAASMLLIRAVKSLRRALTGSSQIVNARSTHGT